MHSILQRRFQTTDNISQKIEEIYMLGKPLSIDILRELLIKELKDIIEPQIIVDTIVEELNFASLYDFVDWYEGHQDGFSSPQRTALDTLIQTRNMINAGCNCKRPQREHIAAEYYQTFWENNAKTDIIPTLLKAAKAKRIRFGNFLCVP